MFGLDSNPNADVGGVMSGGEWAAIVVAIAGILVAVPAVPREAPHRARAFTASGVLVLVALVIGVVTPPEGGNDRAAPPTVIPSTAPTSIEPPPPTPTQTPELERTAYVQQLVPICQAWKRETDQAYPIDPNNFSQAIQAYGAYASILSRGSSQMQRVPRPQADTVVLGTLYNDLDLLAKNYSDMAGAAAAGDQSLATEEAGNVERQVKVYNRDAQTYGFNAACLLPD